jgi:inorganic triphosphatase YgiF
MDSDDLRTLQKMAAEDLVVLGRVISSGRIVAQSKEIKIIRDFVDMVGRLGIDLDRHGMITVQDKARELKLNELEFAKSGEKDITALAEISRVLVEKRPDWQVTYRKANRDIQIVASRTGEATEKVSLDPPDTSVGGALKYIRDHENIAEKMQRAAALGNPGGLIQLVGVIIALALIFIGILMLLDEKKRKWEETLIARIAANEAEISAYTNAMAKLPPGDPNREHYQKEINRLEAENGELRKALEKSQEVQSTLEAIIRALGIAPVVKAIVALSGIILVCGLAMWVLDPASRKS